MEFEGFMYLDIENPIVAWNVYRGVLISQAVAQKNISEGIISSLSMMVARIFADRNWNRLKFEHELEQHRNLSYPDKVSRLTGIFVFDEPESALAAASDEQWGGHISHENLTDVGVWSSGNQTRLDANWISWMLRIRNEGSSEWQAGIKPYWDGTPCPHFPEPIWEVLMHGTVTIWGTTLRNRAYEVIRSTSPNSVALLEQARLAAMLGSSLGHTSALVKIVDEKQVMSFHIDMRDATNEDYINRLNEYKKSNFKQVNWQDLQVGGDMFGIPNFVAYSYVFGS